MKRRNAGFTLLEMIVSTAMFAAGAVYIYATMAGVQQSSANATTQIDLGSENKRSLTRLFAELQASSLTPQDTDGIDATEPEAVFVVEDDSAAPKPHTAAKIVTRQSGPDSVDGTWKLGAGKQQARERTITTNKRIRFRKVIGYQFNAGAGSIAPEWSGWITFQLNERSQLVRIGAGGRRRIVANHIDAFDVEARPDGTVLVTLVTAKPRKDGHGWRRYANGITIHPKN